MAGALDRPVGGDAVGNKTDIPGEVKQTLSCARLLPPGRLEGQTAVDFLESVPSNEGCRRSAGFCLPQGHSVNVLADRHSHRWGRPAGTGGGTRTLRRARRRPPQGLRRAATPGVPSADPETGKLEGAANLPATCVSRHPRPRVLSTIDASRRGFRRRGLVAHHRQRRGQPLALRAPLAGLNALAAGTPGLPERLSLEGGISGLLSRGYQQRQLNRPAAGATTISSVRLPTLARRPDE